MAKKVTTRCDEMRRTTLGVIRAPLRVHCVVTHLLLAHAAILYVTCLSNKTAINRTVHAAHAHISFDVSRLYTPPTVMDSWSCIMLYSGTNKCPDDQGFHSYNTIMKLQLA